MKLSTLAIVLLVSSLIIATISPSNVSAQSECNPKICTVTVNRTISTTNWGVTIAKDNFLLNSTNPITHATIGIPGVMGSHLKYATALDTTTKIALQVTNLGAKQCSTCATTRNYTRLEITFPSAKTGQYSFNLTTIYAGLLTYNQTASTFQSIIEPYPMNDNTTTVTSATLTIDRSDWPTPRLQMGQIVNQTLTGQTFTTTNWKAFNDTTGKIQFSSSGSTQTILDTIASRLITIRNDGSIIVTDYYNLTNKGPSISSVTIPLPKAINDVSVADAIGSLKTPALTPSSNGTSTIAFAPRYGQVATNESTRAQITYSLSRQNYVSMSQFDQYTLTYNTFDNPKFIQPNLITTIQTPPGFAFKSLTGQPYQVNGNQIVLQTSTLTPATNNGFSLTYRLDPFWGSVNTLSWLLLLEAAIAGVAIVTLATRTVMPAGILVGPPQVINRFVELYDEKSSMRLESDKIEEDVARGAMSRFDYRRRRRTIDLRMNELDRALVPVKEQLASISPRYVDMIRRIERAEADLRVVRTTGVDTRNQYRAGRMSRELYESLTTDLERRRERAQQTIDNIIISLREEIR